MTSGNQKGSASQSLDEREANYHAFFELIGHYVTRYQTTEDFLRELFSAAMRGPQERNFAIFDAVRGLETKLKLIDAALIKRKNSARHQWCALRPLIQSAQDIRNSLAHCVPINTGRITVVGGTDGKPGQVIFHGQWMEARKTTHKGESVWKVDDVKRDLGDLDVLWRALIAFVDILHSREPGQHLDEALHKITKT